MSETLATGSSCAANTNHSISLNDAANLTHAWQSLYPSDVWAFKFGCDGNNAIMAPANCSGIRYYFGSTDSDVPQSVRDLYNQYFPEGGVFLVNPDKMVLMGVGSNGGCDDIVPGYILQGANEMASGIPSSPLRSATAAPMAALSCATSDGQSLTETQARTYICNWKAMNSNDPLCYFFGKNTIQNIIQQEGAVGLRAYLGQSLTETQRDTYARFYAATGFTVFSADNMKLVLAGIGNTCTDIIGAGYPLIAQHGKKCPPNCSAASPLLNCNSL